MLTRNCHQPPLLPPPILVAASTQVQPVELVAFRPMPPRQVAVPCPLGCRLPCLVCRLCLRLPAQPLARPWHPAPPLQRVVVVMVVEDKAPVAALEERSPMVTPAVLLLWQLQKATAELCQPVLPEHGVWVSASLALLEDSSSRLQKCTTASIVRCFSVSMVIMWLGMVGQTLNSMNFMELLIDPTLGRCNVQLGST